MSTSRERFWREIFEKSAVRELSDSSAALWSDHGLTRRFGQFERILSSLGIVQDNVLDAGCGPGTYSIHLAPGSRHLVALDVSVNMVNRAKGNVQQVLRSDGSRVDFIVAEVSSLPVRAKSLDLVVCFGVLQYVDDESAAVSEFFRVLKPGGYCIINVPNSRFLLAFRNDLMKKFHPRRFEKTCHRIGFSCQSVFPLILLPNGFHPLERLDRAVSLSPTLWPFAHDFTMVLRRPN